MRCFIGVSFMSTEGNLGIPGMKSYIEICGKRKRFTSILGVGNYMSVL